MFPYNLLHFPPGSKVMKCLFRHWGHLWLVPAMRIPASYPQVDDILEHGEFPRMPQSGSPVVWGVSIWEERSATNGPLLQGAGSYCSARKSWQLACMRPHLPTDTLACPGNRVSLWHHRCGFHTLMTLEAQAATPTYPHLTFSIHTDSTKPSGFIQFAWLLARGWSVHWPMWFLNIRWIRLPSINKVGTGACLSLWVLVHSPDKCSLAPALAAIGPKTCVCPQQWQARTAGRTLVALPLDEPCGWQAPHSCRPCSSLTLWDLSPSLAWQTRFSCFWLFFFPPRSRLAIWPQ